MKQTARTAALQALLQVDENEGYSNIVLDKILKNAGLDRRDSALASTIFYGVLEKRLTLDYFLKSCLKDPAKKLDPTAREALRCGAYQLLYLERVPSSAAVNETVSAVKAMGKAPLAGFVNGVLRGLIRRREELPLPEGEGLTALSLRYSVPEALLSLWTGAYGKENTLLLLEAFQKQAELYIRVNTERISVQEFQQEMELAGVTAEPLDAPEGAVLLKGCGSPTALPQFQRGLFHVQDLSAQLICSFLAPQPGETVCDCCAAPGGKTFTLAQLLRGSGKVYAFDLYKGRAGLIEMGAKRLGLSLVEAGVHDATKPFSEMMPVDRMLCDVPCSGFGVIRRKPEIRYKDLRGLKDLPALQYAILENASRAVKPGGVLVYSTCTLDPMENSGVAERFLRENNGFTPMKIELPGVQRVLDEPEHMLTMMPFAGASDGFFAAAFRKAPTGR